MTGRQGHQDDSYTDRHRAFLEEGGQDTPHGVLAVGGFPWWFKRLWTI